MRKIIACKTQRLMGRRSLTTAVVLPGAILLICMLTACGAQSQGGQATSTMAPTLAASLTPTPTFTPPPTPTTPPSLPLPILDVRPSSMSFVGHLDCKQTSAYVCQAEALSDARNQQTLHWFTSTNIPGNIVFSPSLGTLEPGQNTLITITVPFHDCTQGLFFFHGPANTHTISWAC
ncbi:MAG TPA: hypothetical protein VKQ36_06190 [Ktedonobacterales bacterium]|nr:hypothetical protein [Ktedonobacterales bacterium]